MASTYTPLGSRPERPVSDREHKDDSYGGADDESLAAEDHDLSSPLDPLDPSYSQDNRTHQAESLWTRGIAHLMGRHSGRKLPSKNRLMGMRSSGPGRTIGICLHALLWISAIYGIISLGLSAFGFVVLRPEEDFLPHWGEPGNVGEGLKHYPTDITRDITPIPCHSHNDYWRRIPLYEALHYGLTSVEADVWALGGDGELLVGHDESSLTRNRTFRSLYVDPIIELLDHQNPNTEFANNTRNGVFDTDRGQTLVLLVDIKTDGYKTLPMVQKQLDGLRAKNYLTYFNGKEVVKGAVQVVMTGNTPFDLLIANTTYRDVFFDAPLDRIWQDSKERQAAITAGDTNADSGLRKPSKEKKKWLDSGSGQGSIGTGGITGASFTAENSFYASCSFRDVFGVIRVGKLTDAELKTVRGMIKAAQSQGLKVRFWDTPNWPVGLRHHLWQTLMEEGAAYLNVDDLRDAAKGDWRGGQTWWFW